MRATSAASASSSHSSASRLSTQRPRASASARFFCAPKPGQSGVISTRAPSRRAIATVSSVLPLSTTTISPAKATERRQRSSRAASSRVMTTTDSSGTGMALPERAALDSRESEGSVMGMQGADCRHLPEPAGQPQPEGRGSAASIIGHDTSRRRR